MPTSITRSCIIHTSYMYPCLVRRLVTKKTHHGYMHHQYMYRVRIINMYTSHIILLELPCPFVHWLVGSSQNLPHHRYMYHTYMHASCIHASWIHSSWIHSSWIHASYYGYMHHVYMHHLYTHHVYMHNGYMHLIMDTCIMYSYIMDTCITLWIHA